MLDTWREHLLPPVPLSGPECYDDVEHVKINGQVFKNWRFDR